MSIKSSLMPKTLTIQWCDAQVHYFFPIIWKTTFIHKSFSSIRRKFLKISFNLDLIKSDFDLDWISSTPRKTHLIVSETFPIHFRNWDDRDLGTLPESHAEILKCQKISKILWFENFLILFLFWFNFQKFGAVGDRISGRYE